MEKIIIIGAGPAGLGTAFELSESNRKDIKVIIVDKNSHVGGLARSYTFGKYSFDIGPHRFYTKNTEVLELWKKVLGNNFRKVPRLTRIYYQGKYFLYPIQALDVFKNLGVIELILCFMSYIDSKITLFGKEPKTFSDWVSKKFGKRLYRIFFKTYTEKVWGISCEKISAKWASQRIKNLDFLEILRSLVFKSKAKSLIHEFYYPVHGAGSMYEKMAKIIKSKNGEILLDNKITKITFSKKIIEEVEYENNGKKLREKFDYLFSSLPITDFIFSLYPTPPQKIISAAKKLRYRDHITVNLIINKKLFPDNWVYIHDPRVKMARITNYANFAKKMSSVSPISVEYFVFKEDKIWNLLDEELIDLAKKELKIINLVDKNDVLDGFVIRETESYPMYYTGYEKYFDLVKNYVESFINLQLIGRGGLYKYNNMDHSLYSGMLAARNYLNGNKKYNIWAINEDAEYIEK